MKNMNMNVYAARMLPEAEYFAPGHRACTGCGHTIALRLLMKALGPRTIVSNATGCVEIFSSTYPQTSWEVPWMHVAFETAASVAAGMESGIKVLQRKNRYPESERVTILALAGDGGTADIGLQSLSGALERGHDFLYVCLDNEAYMNTGVQRSSSTPYGSSTTTSPSGIKSIGQDTWKKNMPAIVAAHGIPYVATATISYYFDMVEKIRKAKEIEGPAYVHVFSPCPTGWRLDPSLTVQISRLAVETAVFPLYEIEYGKLTVTEKPRKLKPLADYFKPQRRFAHLPEKEIKKIEKRIRADYRELLRREKEGC